VVINRKNSQITNDFPIQQGLFKTENITSTETPINSTFPSLKLISLLLVLGKLPTDHEVSEKYQA
jgi:hypothetical protein